MQGSTRFGYGISKKNKYFSGAERTANIEQTGVGWLLTYVCSYRKYFPHESENEIMFEIPMAKGYALIAGAMSLDGFLLFSGLQVEGFIKQEIERQMMDKKP
jgi:hypothetical protein